MDFLAGGHIQGLKQQLFKSHANYALMWILKILGLIIFCKGPIRISNGPLKLRNLHAFEWDMGHWPILRVHHHFGLGLSLQKPQSWSKKITSPKQSSLVGCLRAQMHPSGTSHIVIWVIVSHVHLMSSGCPRLVSNSLKKFIGRNIHGDGKSWLFSIRDWEENQPLENGRKSLTSGLIWIQTV